MSQTQKIVRFGAPARAALFGLISMVAGAQAHAYGSLGLDPFAVPNLSSAFIDVNYSSFTDTLTASGFALELDGIAITDGTFDLTATIDDAGNASGGSLSIGGIVAGAGSGTGPLLTGTLSAFGGSSTNTLEFVFDVTGGDAAALYGSSAGVILNNVGSTSLPDDFASLPGFSSVDANADTVAVVPEPGTLGLLLAGGLLAARRRSRLITGA